MNTAKFQNEYVGRRVLITGGLGFIGSNLAHKLLEFGDVEVTILDALFPDQGGNLHNIEAIRDDVNLHVAEMGDASVINHLVGGMDYIFNLAGSISHLDSMLYPHRDLELNCASHITLLEACRHFNPHVKIIFTGTRQVYGKPVYLPLDEKHRLAPLDVNGINKIAAEHYHQLYNRIYGTHTVCLRLTNTYGPRQLLKHNRQGVIPWFIRQALRGETIELYGEGKQRRDMNYVDDVVEALLLAGASEDVEGKILNLGGEEIISLAKFAETLIDLTGRGTVLSVPFPAERQSIDIGNVYSSYKKIHSLLGWQPQTSMREGLARTVAFYQENLSYYLNENESILCEETPTTILNTNENSVY